MKIRFAAIALMFFYVFSNINAKEVNIGYNLEKGHKYYINQTSSQDIYQEINGMEMDMKVSVGGKTSYDVYDIVNDVYHIKLVFETLSFKIESNQMNIEYNSEDETIDFSNPMNKALGAIVGVPFDVQMDKKGKVVSVTGFENIYSNMLDSIGDRSMASAIADNLKRQFGNEAMKGSIEMMTSFYPQESVKVGDSWTNTSTIESGMSLTSTNHLTLVSADESTWNITGKADISTTENAGMEINGMSQKFDLKGTTTFNAKMDAKTGWILESDVHQEIEGSVLISGEQLPQAMEIPMKISSDTKINNL